jgi:SAM-dependent methyltransferase
MDLKERSREATGRHPWEMARLSSLRRILDGRRAGEGAERVLDIGCGDAFSVAGLWEGGRVGRIDAVDAHFTEQDIAALSRRYPQVTFSKSLDTVGMDAYDVVTLLDVLEHVEDDVALLREAGGRLEEDGLMLITAPAFPMLFGGHDRSLGHLRRYTASGLRTALEEAGLRPIASGYLFSLLLPLRAVSVGIEKATGWKRGHRGVGSWHGGKQVTAALTALLTAVDALALKLNSAGLRIPGLSLWSLCEKR